MNTNPEDSVRRPYGFEDYLKRFAWVLVQASVWRIAWSRIPFIRPMLLQLFGAKFEGRCLIRSSVRVHFPWRLRVGANSAISHRVDIYNLSDVHIGDRVVISQDVYLCGGTHDYSDPTYPLIRKPIQLEDDVWVAAGAFIGPGVRIGKGAVVGARSVVFKDVAPWSVVIGNPARVVKTRVLKSR